jgi:hypothetical protein
MAVREGYFSAEHDREVIEAGGFFCHACLVGKPAVEQSPDPRYCQGCYEFLMHEASLLDQRSRPKWLPRHTKQGEISGEKTNKVSGVGVSIMATVKGKKTEVAIIHPAVSARPTTKRGPKHRDLPVDLIMQWAGEGMGSKKITAKLKAEYDITVGFRTIARILSGQRLLV